MGLLDMLQGNGAGGGDELSNGAGNFLSVLGAGLLSGNRFQPIGPGFGQRMDQINKLAAAQGDKASIAALLKLYGFSDQEAMSLASNPKAAELAIAKKQQDTNNAQTASALAGAPGLGNLFGGDGASPVPGMSPAVPGGPAAGVSLNGGQAANAKTIYDGVIARGGSPMLASAVVGNFAKESSFDPAIGGDHRNGVPTSFGLGQWREGRLDALKALGQEQGKDWRTTDVQLDHLFKELNGGDAGAARARALIEQARTPEEAAAIFARHFERPSAEALSNSLPGRQGVAAQAFRSFGQGGAPTQVADASGRIGAPAAPGDGTAIQTEAGPVAFTPSAVPQDPGTETGRSGRPPDAAGISAARRDYFRGGVPPVGSGVTPPPPPPPKPLPGARRAVDVAETEDDVQRLEGRMSMYPPNVYGGTPELQRPQPARMAEAGAADMPAPGASDAGFYVPGVNGQPGRTYTGRTAEYLRGQEEQRQERAVANAPPGPEGARGPTGQRAAAIRHYGYWSSQLARAGSNKTLAEYAKSQMDLSKEFMKPDQIEAKLDAAGIVGQERQDIIRRSFSDNRPSDVQKYEYGQANPGFAEYEARQGSGGSKIAGDIQARKAAAAEMGLRPDSPEYRSFTLTGKFPREDQQPLTATDKKAIMEADEGVLSARSAIDNLNKAVGLSAKAYEGPTAYYRGYATSFLKGDEAGKATLALDNIITTNSLGQLKAIFGGNPTEGERKILLDIQGASSQPHEVRVEIFKRAIAAAERRMEFNRERAASLRGQDYYKPQGTPSGARGEGAGQQPATFSAPPQAAVDALRSNTGLREQFDAKYGPGAAARALGGR